MNLSSYFIWKNSLYLPSKTAEIKLFDYYPISESTKETITSINSQGSVTESVAQGSGYLASFTSSSSSLFVQGLMLSEIIFLLKFIDINYPPMVKQMFESKNNNPSILFSYTFIEDPKDLEAVPPLFRFYKVSVYFLNNVGESLCQMAAFILIATLFLKITPYYVEPGKKVGIGLRILIIIRDALVWEMSLFFILMNLQKLFFFTASSWMFPPLNSLNALLNLSLASILGFFLILWVFHLCFKINICQDFKIQNSMEKTADKNLIEDNNSIFSAKNHKNNIFSKDLSFGSETPNESFSPIKTFKKTTFKINPEPKKNEEEILDEIPIIGKEKMNLLEKFKKMLFLIFLVKNFLFKPQNKYIFVRRYEVLHL